MHGLAAQRRSWAEQQAACAPERSKGPLTAEGEQSIESEKVSWLSEAEHACNLGQGGA
jgi:hypothetical protein